MKGLSLVSFFNDISSEMIYPLLPAFLSGTLGAGATVLGAIDGAAQLATALLNWVSGRLSDRPGLRKPLILVGYGTAVLVRPLISTAISAWQVVGLRVLDRVGKGLRSAPRDALLAESTPPELHGRAFGMNRAADHAGAVLGALLGGWALTASVDVRTIIAWSAAPGIIAFVVLSVVLKGVKGGQESRAKSSEGEARPTGPSNFNSQLKSPIVLLAIFALARLPELLIILRLQELGVAVPLIPFAWAALHVIRSTASYPAGRLNDKIGPDLLIGAGAAVFAFCLALLGKPLPAAWALAVFILLGLVAAFTEPAERALVAKLSPKGLGKGYGLYYALTGSVALPAGVLFGWVYQHQGASDALWGSGALVGVMGIVWMVVRRGPGVGRTA